MPRGATHLKSGFAFITGASLLLIVCHVSGLFRLSDPVESIALFAGVGLFSLYFLDPDLDTRSQALRRWGAFRFIWIPYRTLCGGHRGLSHSVFLGPLSKILYLLVVLLGFSLGLQLLGLRVLPLVQDILEQLTRWKGTQTPGLWFIVGLYTPHVFHLVLDRVLKKRRWRVL